MKEKIIGAGGLATVCLLLRAALEFVASESDWPPYFKDLALAFLQHPLAWIVSGGLGVLIGWHVPESYTDRRDVNIETIMRDERGSIRTRAAVGIAVLALGLSAGALAEPTVDTARQLLSKIGEVAISSPAISPVGKFY